MRTITRHPVRRARLVVGADSDAATATDWACDGRVPPLSLLVHSFSQHNHFAALPFLSMPTAIQSHLYAQAQAILPHSLRRRKTTAGPGALRCGAGGGSVPAELRQEQPVQREQRPTGGHRRGRLAKPRDGKSGATDSRTACLVAGPYNTQARAAHRQRLQPAAVPRGARPWAAGLPARAAGTDAVVTCGRDQTQSSHGERDQTQS